MTATNGTTWQIPACEVCGAEIDRSAGYIPTGTGYRHFGCRARATPTPTTQPPSTVLARVWRDLHGPEGPYSSAQVEAALRQAMIPTQAPYAEWEDAIPRALSFLPAPEASCSDDA